MTNQTILRRSTNGSEVSIPDLLANESPLFVGNLHHVPAGTESDYVYLKLDGDFTEIPFQEIIPELDTVYTIGLRIGGGYAGSVPTTLLDDITIDVVRYNDGKTMLSDHRAPFNVYTSTDSNLVPYTGSSGRGYYAAFNGTTGMFRVQMNLAAELNVQVAIWLARPILVLI